MKFKEKYFKSKKYDLNIKYLDNDIKSDTTIVVFPGGGELSSIVEHIYIHLPYDKRIVSFDYPSRGKSERYKGYDTIDMIAEVAQEFLKEVKSKRYILLGLSFGTAVITKLAYKLKGDKYKIVLINPGEFFAAPVKLLLKVLFYPSFKFAEYRRWLKRVVTKKLGILHGYELPDDSLLNIGEQWYSTLFYKIDTKKTIKHNCIIAQAKYEFINSPSSLKRAIDVFDYCEVVKYDGGHITSYSRYKNSAKKVFDKLKRVRAFD